MERRGCGVGCIVAWLGLALSCCVLPYLLSSIYSLASAVIEGPTAVPWLWGEWLGQLVEVGSAPYVALAEGPMICAGGLILLIVVLGVILMITGVGRRQEYYDYDEETYEPYGE